MRHRSAAAAAISPPRAAPSSTSSSAAPARWPPRSARPRFLPTRRRSRWWPSADTDAASWPRSPTWTSCSCAPKRAEDEVRALVERALALLWDSRPHRRPQLPDGGGVRGHGARGPALAHGPDRGAAARGQPPPVRRACVERLDEARLRRTPRTTAAFLDALRQDLEERYARYGRAVGLLEPHVKESAGGLRDLHVILWIGHALFGARGLSALHERGVLADARAQGRAARLRPPLAASATRRTSPPAARPTCSTSSCSPSLAESLGYRPRSGLLASEIFMRDYYERAAELHRISRAFLLRHAPAPRGALLPGPPRPRPRGTFEIRDGQLHPRGEAAALGSARRLLQAFAIAQREGPELSEELKLDIRGSLRLVDRALPRVARGRPRVPAAPAAQGARGPRASRHARDGPARAACFPSSRA